MHLAFVPSCAAEPGSLSEEWVDGEVLSGLAVLDWLQGTRRRG